MTMYPLSDHFDGRKFHNHPSVVVSEKGFVPKMIRAMLQQHPRRTPSKPPGPFFFDTDAFAQRTGHLRVTWLGHSTTLIELDGKRFLTDPVWYQRASPFTYAGPKRFFDVPVPLDRLPHIDAVLLSHDHYDHLDKETLLFLTGKKIPVITLLGVGRRLTNWGVDKSLVTELDWWQTHEFKTVSITAAPAQHFSGRSLADRFSTLWGSFVLKGAKESVYFGADSGYHSGFQTIGERFGPFDLTMLDTGAYYKLWTQVHMGPENAVKAHLELNGRLLLPIHWGTFALAFHPWTEPVKRVLKEAARKGVSLLLPVPGQTVPVAQGAFNSEWWKKYD